MPTTVMQPATSTGATASETLKVGPNGSGTADAGGYPFEIFGVYVVSDSAFGDESIVLSLDSGTSSSYDVEIVSQNMNAETDFVYHPYSRMTFSQKDDFLVTVANSGTNNIYITVHWGKIEGSF